MAERHVKQIRTPLAFPFSASAFNCPTIIQGNEHCISVDIVASR